MNDGGPAYPTTLKDIEQGLGGMSLRDCFAAKAMLGMIIGGNASINYVGKNGSVGMSKDAYIVADSMLAERDR